MNNLLNEIERLEIFLREKKEEKRRLEEKTFNIKDMVDIYVTAKMRYQQQQQQQPQISSGVVINEGI